MSPFRVWYVADSIPSSPYQYPPSETQTTERWLLMSTMTYHMLDDMIQTIRRGKSTHLLSPPNPFPATYFASHTSDTPSIFTFHSIPSLLCFISVAIDTERQEEADPTKTLFRKAQILGFESILPLANE